MSDNTPTNTDTRENAQVVGYLKMQYQPAPESFNAGYSMYVAAWPLVESYPGSQFQTGLFGTWMFGQPDDPPPTKRLYSDIEGGLGWWRDTQYPTITPKFIMGGVALNFVAWANGPGAGKGRDWNHPAGHYGVAQLSPCVLWPPDGLNVKQGTCGELWGYGYLPLPLIQPKATTGGKPIPTGGNCWTLFLNTANFKGPVAFFTPYFFSHVAEEDPSLAGKFLDTRPTVTNRPVAMETQHIPAMQATDNKGETYAKIARTRFPVDEQDASVVLHQVRAYSKKALWDQVQTWLEDDGSPANGKIDCENSHVFSFMTEQASNWSIDDGNTPREKRIPLDWQNIVTAVPRGEKDFEYRWNTKWVKREGPLVTLPEYYKLTTNAEGKLHWTPVQPERVPAETGLTEMEFTPKPAQPMPPYVTPEDPDSCWKKPGPAAGPFEAKPGDGSTVVYYWYRFADQPALLNADLSDAEREELQSKVERLHRQWHKDDEYLPPPEHGTLAEIDPALIVEPPKGLEAGYVPIVTWQGIAES